MKCNEINSFLNKAITLDKEGIIFHFIENYPLNRCEAIEILKWLIKDNDYINFSKLSRIYKHVVEESMNDLLLYSVHYGRRKICAELLKQGPDIDSFVDGKVTLLYKAVLEANDEFVQLLLSKGADPNKAVGLENHAFLVAIRRNMKEIVNLFIQYGMDVNMVFEHNQSPLMEAANMGNTEIVKVLLDHGADVTLKNETGMLAIDHATKHIDTFMLLFDTYPEVNYAVVFASLGGHVATLKFLIAGGADVNVQLANGNTALSIAITFRRSEVVKLLIEHRCDVNIKNNKCTSPLMKAAEIGNMEYVRWLLEAGADVNMIDRFGESALTYAKKKGYDGIARLLMENGATMPITNIVSL